MKKRIVAMFLAVCFIVTLLPTAAFAAGDADTSDWPTVTVTESGKLAEAVKEMDGWENLTKLKVVTEGTAELTPEDFQFLSCVVVSETADGRYSAEYTPNTDIGLVDLEQLDLTDAKCQEDAIPPRAFQKNTKITTIYLPSSLKRTYIHAFSMMSGLTHLSVKGEENFVFPKSMEIMGEGMVWTDSALAGTIDLTDLPNLKTIGGGCFYGSGLSGEVTIPATVDIVKNPDVNKNAEDGYGKSGYTFGKTNITSLTIQGNPESIGSAFAQNCTQLASVTLPSSVKSIGSEAFYKTALTQCPNLENVTEIGSRAFSEITSFNNDIVIGENTAVGNQAFANSKTTGKLILKASELGENCFSGFSAGATGELLLGVAEIPDGFYAQQDSRHENNESATFDPFELKEGVKSVGSNAFNANCLTGTLTLPKSLETIGGSAFRRNNFIGDLVIPENVTSIGAAAFSYAGSFDNIVVKNPNVALNKYAFANQKDGVKIYFASSQTNDDYYWYTSEAIILNTDGGEIDLNTDEDETGLRTPTLKNGEFLGWYDDATDEKLEAPATAQKGRSYTAKWHKNAELTTNIGEQTFIVGQPTEFTFTTTANDDKDIMVVGSSNFSDPDAIEKLEYLETNGEHAGEWFEFTGDFGPSTGFPMMDATSTFRVTFNKAGTYSFTASMVKVSDGKALCSTDVEFKVRAENEPVEPDEEVSSGSTAGTDAAVILGGVAISAATYFVGTQIWMETHLPDGTIPTSREQLALMLWNAAGKPQPAETALYADISAEAADAQLAARWCVEQGLMKDYGESFQPGKYTFRPQVIKAWNQLQKMNG